jgi:hypothetical protein
MSGSENRRCRGTTRDGRPCRVTFDLNPRTGLCRAHDPERAEERRRACVLGGKTTAEARRKRSRTIDAGEAMDPPTTAAEAKEWSAWLVVAAATGVLDKGTVGQAVGALRVFLASLKQADYEAALAELKDEVKRLKNDRNTEERR